MWTCIALTSPPKGGVEWSSRLQCWIKIRRDKSNQKSNVIWLCLTQYANQAIKQKLLGHNFLEHHDVENYIHLEGTILLRNRLRTMNFQTGLFGFPDSRAKLRRNKKTLWHHIIFFLLLITKYVDHKISAPIVGLNANWDFAQNWM